MSSQEKVIREVSVLTANEVQPANEAWDVANYKVLELDFNVVQAGSTGTATLQHAAVNRENAFFDHPGITPVNLNAAGHTYVHVDGMLRFVRWKGGGNPTGNPVFGIIGLAKE